MKILGTTLPLVAYPGLAFGVHPHQADMLDRWNACEAFFVATKTGSGKTAATVLPIALNRDREGDNSAVFVYPTNELIRDQARSIVDWLTKRLGLLVKEITPDNANDPAGEEQITVVRADADLLARYCSEPWNLMRHGQPMKARALERLLTPDKPKILLTNPDTLYLLYSLRYGQGSESALAQLQAFQTIVFDEFHLYGGMELAHVLYLIHAAREFGAFKRVVLLSATPHPGVRKWLDLLLHPHEIDVDTPVSHPVMGHRQVAHDVHLSWLCAQDRVGATAAKIAELEPRLRELRAATQRADYVPMVVILNSVTKAIDLEDRLRANGFAQDEIVPIRGLSSRGLRRLQPNQLLVIGTAAIEVGIDFQCDYLIFEAGDSASFMQRFGRLGRHRPGEALFLGSRRECQVLEAAGAALSRAQLEEVVARSYPQADARAWFVGTEMGAFAALSQAFNIRERLWQDRNQGPGVEDARQQVFEELKVMMAAYAELMQIRPQVASAQRIFWLCKRGTGQKWVDDYLKIDTFRTSLPSIDVYDLAEERRHGPGTALYRVDVGSLLARATRMKGRGDLVEIDGYGQVHRVTVTSSFRNDQVNAGVLQTTRDYPALKLARDGGIEACSDVMSRLGKEHAFVFVPYDDVADLVDWRLATFPCGLTGKAKYVLAFDGDALLLREIWKRLQCDRAE